MNSRDWSVLFKGENDDSISIGLVITYGWKLDTEGNWITLDDAIEQFRDLYPHAKRLSDKGITGILFARFTGHKKGTDTKYVFYRGVTGDYQIDIDIIGNDGTEEGKHDFEEAEELLNQ
ncbi:MAG: hypothetical protein R2883_04450 [Caldisericia bacterium]